MSRNHTDWERRQRDSLIVELYSVYSDNGTPRSYRQIAAAVSHALGRLTSDRTVHRALKTAGVDVRAKKRRTVEERVGKDLMLETARRYDDGEIELVEAAKILNCSTTAASIWLRRVLNVSRLRQIVPHAAVKEAMLDLMERGVTIAASARKLGLTRQSLGKRMRKVYGGQLPIQDHGGRR